MNAKRVFIAFTIALLVSGGCTWFVARRLRAQPAAQNQPDFRYAAPSRDIEAGEVLKADNLKMVGWHGSEPIVGAFDQIGGLIGREVLFPLGKGLPILGRDLSASGSGTGLASKIPGGMRAVALRSDEVVGVAGFLVPGSHLDVLVTYRSDRSPEPVTATVLQNAVVIAAGQQIEPDPGGKPAAVTVVTLLLTPLESERAVLASTQGAIHFILRNGVDDSRTNNSPLLLSQLSGENSAKTNIAPRSATPGRVMPSAPKRHEIEIVLGGSPIADSQRTDAGAKQ